LSQLPYPAVFKACLNNREVYLQNAALLEATDLQAESPEYYQLGQCLRHLWETTEWSSQTPGSVFSIADLRITYQTLYPKANLRPIEPILSQIEKAEVSSSVLAEFLYAYKSRHSAMQIAKLALAIAEGREGPEALSSIPSLITPYQTEDKESEFIDDEDFQALYDKQISPGLRWRLGTLNRNLGSLRRGDFGFLFARPETGKTTFLASELSFMAENASGPIFWFANEEAPEKVLVRIIQATLGVEANVLFRDIDESKRAYRERTHNRIKLPRFELCNKSDIERLCARDRPALIVFDQIDKIRGFSADRNDLELTEIYQWARELAKRFCPVIGVCQAGASAEGKKWLTFNDVNNSKTGKQGEADWMLGIGKSQDESLSYERFFHLSKNKLLGDSDANPDMRHGKWGVRIKPEIARYEDFE